MLSVIFYHYNVDAFSGGYVGVDIFFVISGYLITSALRKKQVDKNFSLWSFYVNRFRRIFPALFAISAITVLLSLLIFLPDDAVRAIQAASFSLLGVSNFYFQILAGDYWSPNNDAQPFLHTWSLSVEAQFYIIWPIFLTFLWKRMRHFEIFAFSCIAGISFVAAQIWLSLDSSAAFYLLPFRLGELAIGALVSAIVSQFPPRGKIIGNLLAVFGLCLIAAAIFLYTADTPFPGVMALIPTLGTAFVILAGQNTYPSRLLSIGPMRAIGLVSYSLYLIHWPIWVLYSYWRFSPLDAFEIPMLIMIAFVISIGVFRWIEVPFRSKTEQLEARPSRVRGSIFFVLAAIFIIPIFSQARIASIQNFLGASNPLGQLSLGRIAEFDLGVCARVEPAGLRCNHTEGADHHILLIGDSHAQHFRPLFKSVAENTNSRFESWTLGSCYPVFGVRPFYAPLNEPSARLCGDLIRTWENYVVEEEPDVVILAAAWSSLLEGGMYAGVHRDRHYLLLSDDDMISSARTEFLLHRQLVSMFRQISSIGAHIVFVQQVPDLARDPMSCALPPLYSDWRASDCRFATPQEVSGRLENIRSLAALAARDSETQITLLDFQPFICDGSLCGHADDGQLLYEDATHLSTFGSFWLYNFISLTSVISTHDDF